MKLVDIFENKCMKIQAYTSKNEVTGMYAIHMVVVTKDNVKLESMLLRSSLMTSGYKDLKILEHIDQNLTQSDYGTIKNNLMDIKFIECHTSFFDDYSISNTHKKILKLIGDLGLAIKDRDGYILVKANDLIDAIEKTDILCMYNKNLWRYSLSSLFESSIIQIKHIDDNFDSKVYGPLRNGYYAVKKIEEVYG